MVLVANDDQRGRPDLSGKRKRRALPIRSRILPRHLPEPVTRIIIGLVRREDEACHVDDRLLNRRCPEAVCLTNRFRAAAVQKPIINMASFVLTADQPDYYARYWFGKMPWEDPGSYWERSPLSLAGQIRTPALIIVGDQDHRTPPSEAEQLYAALKLRGVSTRLIRVPGANHAGLAARPSQAVARVAAIVDWFGQFDH